MGLELCLNSWAVLSYHVARNTTWALNVLHVICTRLLPGHLSVLVGDSSRRSEKIVKNLALRLWMSFIIIIVSIIILLLLLLLLSLLLILLLSSLLLWWSTHIFRWWPANICWGWPTNNYLPMIVLRCYLMMTQRYGDNQQMFVGHDTLQLMTALNFLLATFYC